jgi:hypothetical protein
MLNVWLIQATFAQTGETETVDYLDGTEREARELAWEYGIAFGPSAHVEAKRGQVDPLD